MTDAKDELRRVLRENIERCKREIASAQASLDAIDTLPRSKPPTTMELLQGCTIIFEIEWFDTPSGGPSFGFPTPYLSGVGSESPLWTRADTDRRVTDEIGLTRFQNQVRLTHMRDMLRYIKSAVDVARAKHIVKLYRDALPCANVVVQCGAATRAYDAHYVKPPTDLAAAREALTSEI